MNHPELRKRTKEFALRILRLFAALPKSAVAQTLGKQLVRSGTSVGANYREAQRGRSKAEFVAKVGESLRELDETAYWLELLVESETIPAAKLNDLQRECEELLCIFVTILRQSKRRPDEEPPE